jgi:hypothetical protein
MYAFNDSYSVFNIQIDDLFSQRSAEDVKIQLPRAIKNLYPTMSEKEYLRKKEDIVWLYSLSRCCDHCAPAVKYL